MNHWTLADISGRIQLGERHRELPADRDRAGKRHHSLRTWVPLLIRNLGRPPDVRGLFSLLFWTLLPTSLLGLVLWLRPVETKS
jgi:hypothetical protein